MSSAIYTTRPTADGYMLWSVTLNGSYWDNDPRDSRSVPVEDTVFVLARSYDEALRKGKPFLAASAKDCSKGTERIEAHIATIENLVVARVKSSTSFEQLVRVKFSDPHDVMCYKLVACLVPIEPDDGGTR